MTLRRWKSAAQTFYSRVTARTCAANASLRSIRSMSVCVSWARARARAVAGTGPIPMRCGSTPATAREVRRAAQAGATSTARRMQMRDDAHRGGVVLTAGVAGRHRGVRIDREPDRPERFQRLGAWCPDAGARPCRRSTSCPVRRSRRPARSPRRTARPVVLRRLGDRGSRASSSCSRPGCRTHVAGSPRSRASRPRRWSTPPAVTR
jgi:hypothetical protein